jgi:hypothetical protein
MHIALTAALCECALTERGLREWLCSRLREAA